MANVEAFTNLLRVLHEVKDKPDAGFDMSAWVKDIKMIEEPQSCGFSGCACGWATQDKWFQEQGLGVYAWFGGGTQLSLRKGDDEYSGWDAVCELFGIELEHASYLFDEMYYDPEHGKPSVVDVLHRLHSFVDFGYQPAEEVVCYED